MASNIENLTGRVLGNCTLTSLIGRGGMGAVYAARQTRPSRNVAIKVLLPNLAADEMVYEEFLIRFRREADLVARLEHVNIMPIYEYGEEGGMAYLVMPYLSGGSLRDVLSQRGTLSLQEAISYIDQAASALDYAHALGVVHRDLKPANFLLHADGRLVLADFGIARIIGPNNVPGATITSTGSILGTPEYMAPEMVSGSLVDYRADIYELGVVLFQMLSGHVPFTASSPFAVAVMQMQETLPLLQQMNPAMPSAVDAVIQKATAKQREDRYPSAQAMAQALRQASTSADSWPAATILPRKSLVLPAPTNAPQTSTPLSPTQFHSGSSYADAPMYAQTQARYPRAQSYAIPQTRKPKGFPWGLLIGLLIALIVIAGGTFAALQFFGPGQGPTSGNNSGAQVPAPTTVPTPTATTAPVPSVALPTGTPLYSSISPDCSSKKGWEVFQVAVKCEGTRTLMTALPGHVGGLFFTRITGKTYPTNYAVRVRMQLTDDTTADYGIYFRSSRNGGYIFLARASGHWQVDSYGANGALSVIAQGNNGIAMPTTPVSLTVAINGSQFSFYENERFLGNVSDATYATGTTGIAVNQNGTVAASNFTLYASSPASSNQDQ